MQISAANSVVVEENVSVSMGVFIVDHMLDHNHLDTSVHFAPNSKPLPVRIGKGSYLGLYCVIGPRVEIGEHVVAANAVVTRDVPSYCMAIGNPARLVRFHASERNNLPAVEPAGTERG